MLQRLEQEVGESNDIEDVAISLSPPEITVYLDGGVLADVKIYSGDTFADAFRLFAEAHIPSMTELADPVEQQKGLT